MSERNQKVSTLVKQARGSMSQRAFGMELGVSSTAVQHWENGSSVPDTKHLANIAAKAGYTLQQVQDYLDGGELPDLDIVTQMTRQINKLSFKQVVLIDRAVSDRLVAIAESAGR